MPTSSKKGSKKPATVKAAAKKQSTSKRPFARMRQRYEAFLQRRPHRSFQLTRRRDAVRPLPLPGNIAFTHEVNKTLWHHRKIFLLLAVLYAFLYVVLVGLQSQDTFTTLTQGLSEAGAEISGGEWGAFEQVSAVLLSMATVGVGAEMTEAQQIFSVLIFLLVWLTSVWLLRNLLAGHKVKLRDGLYNAGAPLFSTVMIALLIVVQLLPVALAMTGYSAASASGLLESGVAAMLFWIAAALLGVLSLYWITSSLLAMIIITIPGVYPYQAVKSAGDLVLGRRVKLLLRWLWMAVVLVVAWLVVMIPIILLDMWIKGVWPAVEWLPILPVTLLVLSAATIVWVSAYVYLLYRKVVDYVPES